MTRPPKLVTRNLSEKCVMARIMRQNKLYKKDFYVSRYGSWENAQMMASDWVHKLAATLPPIKSTEGTKTVRNKSGEVGVNLSKKVFRKDGKTHQIYYRWTAQWTDCPFTGGLSWSIQEFGEDDAYVLAVLSRRQRSVDRQALYDYMEKIRYTDEYKQILSQRPVQLAQLS